MIKDYISKRKSTRKFEMKPLDEKVLKDIEDFAKTMKPLYENIAFEYSFVNAADVKNILPIKAPHYIVISSEHTEGYLTNIGFLFQQMDLYLSSISLGSCWLGMAKPTEKLNTKLEFVIILAFGKALHSPYRELSEFKRKSLADISNIADKRLEVARLAPSAANTQPWYFVDNKDGIDVYCVKGGVLKALMYKRMNKIDMGIALSHLYLSNSNFEFTVEQNPQELKGYSYMGSVKIS
jgi:nitroreductase